MFGQIKSLSVLVTSVIIGGAIGVNAWPSVDAVQSNAFAPELGYAGALGAAVAASLSALITYRPFQTR